MRFLFLLDPMTDEDRRREEERRRREQEAVFSAASLSAAGVTARGGIETVARKTARSAGTILAPAARGRSTRSATG